VTAGGGERPRELEAGLGIGRAGGHLGEERVDIGGGLAGQSADAGLGRQPIPIRRSSPGGICSRRASASASRFWSKRRRAIPSNAAGRPRSAVQEFVEEFLGFVEAAAGPQLVGPGEPRTQAAADAPRTSGGSVGIGRAGGARRVKPLADLGLGEGADEFVDHLPSWKAITRGMLEMRSACEMYGASSVLSLARRKAPFHSAASFSRTGPSWRHGPHQGAQKSTTTGRVFDFSMTCASKSAFGDVEDEGGGCCHEAPDPAARRASRRSIQRCVRVSEAAFCLRRAARWAKSTRSSG
jgi:hypothetical protein